MSFLLRFSSFNLDCANFEGLRVRLKGYCLCGVCMDMEKKSRPVIFIQKAVLFALSQHFQVRMLVESDSGRGEATWVQSLLLSGGGV